MTGSAAPLGGAKHSAVPPCHVTRQLHADLLLSTRRRSRTSKSAVAADVSSDDAPELVATRSASHGRASADDLADHEESMTTLQHFFGTALVLAFLQVTQLQSVAVIASHRSRAVRHFAGVMTPSGWSFADTMEKFLTLLSPGILSSRLNWLNIAFLWRLILAQDVDGSWGCTSTVAFALQARASREVEELKLGFFARLKERMISASEMGAELADDAGDATDLAENLAARMRHDDTDAGVILEKQERADAHAAADMAPVALVRTSEATRPSSAALGARQDDPSINKRVRSARSARLLGAQHADGTMLDDPLSFSVLSIEQAIPRRLAAFEKHDAAAGEPDTDVRRVWTTLCCIAALERLTLSWLWGDGERWYEQERTIVDAGREWLETYAAARPRLAAALADGALARAASRTTRGWRRAWMASIGDLRRSQAMLENRTLSQLERTYTGIMRALITKHGARRLVVLHLWHKYTQCTRRLLAT